jgi:2-iminobutanoate/2-iminopropanoate deaminase
MAHAKRENIKPEGLPPRIRNGQEMFPHVVSVEGSRMIYVSGQLAWDETGAMVGHDDMAAQFLQIKRNIEVALGAAGAEISDIVKATTYVTDMDAFMDSIDARQELFGPAFPASTTVEIRRLAHPGMMVEIDVIAVVN